MKLHPDVSTELENIDMGTLQKAIQLVRMGVDPSNFEEPRVSPPPLDFPIYALNVKKAYGKLLKKAYLITSPDQNWLGKEYFKC